MADMKKMDYSYEKTFGPLKFEQLPKINWELVDEIRMLFPLYMRETLKMELEGVKQKTMNAMKSINIENFNLMTPDEAKHIFVKTQLVIPPRKRSAMYGQNGVGKTLLFKSMCDRTIKGFPKHLNVYHMEELDHHPESEKLSVIDTILNAHPYRRILVACEETLVKKIEAKEGNVEALEANLKFVQMQMKSIGGYTAVQRIQRDLRVLGFDEIGEARPLSALSGGLRMRVALASAFFIEPELLLLDEPTNHLDFPSVLWLENRLRGYKGAFVVVTHDRQLLENVCTSVLLLQDKKIVNYDCSFSEFEKRKSKEDDKKDKDIDKFLQKNRNVDSASALAKTKAEYQAWQTRHHERKVMLAGKFTFKDPIPLKTKNGEEQKDVSLIHMKEVRFSYNPEGGHFIFNQPVSFNVKFGTRVGVMGPNGAGKSTFLKLLTGKLTATTGEIVTNPDFKLAYFGQHSTKELSMDETPFEFMCRMFPEENPGLLSKHLSKTSVTGDSRNTRMIGLSYSQRSCVIFAKLTYVPPHLLIMDEPTNFLDLDSVDSLIAATNKFTGALLVVTHSRHFLKACADEFLSIVPGQFLTFPNMKEAEAATYSFMEAMESGKKVDLKSAIMKNPGGGSVHHSQVGDGKAAIVAATKDSDGNLIMAEYVKPEKKKSAGLSLAEQKKVEEAEKARIAAEIKARKQAKKAALKTDWVVGDKCFIAFGGKFHEGEVVMANMMGVTVTFDGKKKMVSPNKIYETKPVTELPKKKVEPKKTDGKKFAGKKDGKKSFGNKRGPRTGKRVNQPRKDGFKNAKSVSN